MRLIDTNVVVYAGGKDHPLKDSARRILSDIAGGALQANLDAETLQEILHLYSSRGERRKGFETLRDILVLFPNPIPVGREEVEKACDFMQQYFFLGARDAIHAAVVILHGLEGIITADRVFDRIKGVRKFEIK